MANRVRGVRARIIYWSVMIFLGAGVVQDVEFSWMAATILIAGIACLQIEVVVHRNVLRSRKRFDRNSRAVVFAVTVLAASFPALYFGDLFSSTAAGSDAMAVFLFFGMAVQYLRWLQGALSLYLAAIVPSYLVMGYCEIISPDHLGMNELAMMCAFAGGSFAFGQLIYSAHKIHVTENSLRIAKGLALDQARVAERAAKSKSEFLAVISHELRTPMNAMLGSAELLRRTDLKLEQRGHLEAVLDGGSLLLSLLNDVLDMAKIEAGALETEAIPVDLERLIYGLERLWQSRATDKKLEFVLELDADLPNNIVTDPTRLRQVLFNLLSNAVKFTKEGSIGLHVRQVENEAGEAEIQFEVSDTGTGIDSETVAKLFKPFQQADSSTARNYGGSGLGLSICKGLSKAMGGRISLESELGKGSRFFVSLPLIEAETPVDDDADDEELVGGSEAQILVAEDHPANRRLLGALLQPLGFEVIMACNGKETLDMFDLDHFDLILMDVQMPEMDGLEATRRIRQLPGHGQTVPIVALTANASLEDRNNCFEAGMDDFITKPIDPRQLHSAIVRAVNKSRQAVANAKRQGSSVAKQTEEVAA